MNYYPHNIGDYAAATRGLSLAEHGAYRTLLDLYYLDEQPLPAAPEALCRAVGARGEEERAAVLIVALNYFEERDGLLYRQAHQLQRRHADVSRGGRGQPRQRAGLRTAWCADSALAGCGGGIMSAQCFALNTGRLVKVRSHRVSAQWMYRGASAKLSSYFRNSALLKAWHSVAVHPSIRVASRRTRDERLGAGAGKQLGAPRPDGSRALLPERGSTSCSTRRAARGRRCATQSRRPRAALHTASPRVSQLLQTPAREGTCPTR